MIELSGDCRVQIRVLVLAVAVAGLALSGCGSNGSKPPASTSPAGPSSPGTGTASAVNHVIFLLQENRSFDSYFGMLNPYRSANGWTTSEDGKAYAVDGIDDKMATVNNANDEGQVFPLFKFKSSCIDNASSSWLESFGDVNPFDFSLKRTMGMTGFVHNAEGYAKSCATSGTCSGQYTDLAGQRAMGYYDQNLLNYYYYMASQFAVSDRWFSPVASKSTPNRLATMTGGTTQGLVMDPGNDDHLGRLDIPSIFEELDKAGVSWKIYYTVTQAQCLDPENCSSNGKTNYPDFPATTFGYLGYSTKYMYQNPSGAACTAPTQPSSVVGDAANTFCIDPTHVAPLKQYYTDLTNGTLPSFAYIEPGYGINDEHPGSGESVLTGQSQAAQVINAFMTSPEWKDSVFFFSYDEGGGPFDHVPPVPGHSNDYTAASLGSIPDISTIAVNPDKYMPCVPPGGTPTVHCDLPLDYPGANITDAVVTNGFATQIGFRVPDIVISPFARKHYVSHIPMDHTAVIKFVESRFIGSSAHLTARDAAQPDLMDFFDFTAAPWATPPNPPAPATPATLGSDPCTPASM